MVQENILGPDITVYEANTVNGIKGLEDVLGFLDNLILRKHLNRRVYHEF